MKIEAWILAVVGAGTGEQPWAEIHPTAEKALRSMVNTYRPRLGHLTLFQAEGQSFVADALDEIAYFTIEPVVIDTNELTR